MGNFAAGSITPASKTVGLERAIYDCPKFYPVIQDKKTTVWRNCQQAQLMYYHPSRAALDQLADADAGLRPDVSHAP